MQYWQIDTKIIAFFKKLWYNIAILMKIINTKTIMEVNRYVSQKHCN